MSKKNKPLAKPNQATMTSSVNAPEISTSTTSNTGHNMPAWLHQLGKGFIPYIIISVLGIAVYMNTFHHQFALDDDIIICKNEYVLKGVKGMGDIMTKDVFDSFYKSMNLTAQLAGGRYRPFSVATYAIEQEFIGTLPDGLKPDSWDVNKNKLKDKGEDLSGEGLYTDRDFKLRGTMLRHVNNVLLYVLSVTFIYLFLSSFFFKDNKWLALLASLIFLLHPIHTEVVANMKSRDEILSLMFIVLTLYLSFRYMEQQNKKLIIWACITYFIALLSKEYGASLLIMVPLGLYVYHKQLKLSSLVPLMGGLAITFAIYYYIRSGIVLDIDQSSVQDSELLNNPYLLASESEASATKTFVNLKYFILLCLPTVLSSDYSYNVIHYRTYSDPEVWLSILILLTAAAGLIYTLRKRHWLAFPIAFALIHLMLVNNMFFNIGASMGERLVYHSSLGTSMLTAYGIYYICQRFFKNAVWTPVVLLPLLLFYGYKTIARNPAWKNDYTLTMTDVQSYPESILLCGNACNRMIEMSEFPVNKGKEKIFLDSAAGYGLKALQLHPKYVTTYMNMGMIKMKLGDVDSAASYWDKVIQLFPTHPNVPQIRMTLLGGYTQRANAFLQKRMYNEGLAELLKAYKFASNNDKLCFDIGNVFMILNNPAKAREYWAQGIRINPGNPNLQQALRSVGGM